MAKLSVLGSQAALDRNELGIEDAGEQLQLVGVQQVEVAVCGANRDRNRQQAHWAEDATVCKAERTVTLVITDLERQGACDMFEVCDQVRQHMISVFEHIQMLIADANMSYAIGDSESAEEAIAKALILINQLREQLRQLGYLE